MKFFSKQVSVVIHVVMQLLLLCHQTIGQEPTTESPTFGQQTPPVTVPTKSPTTAPVDEPSRPPSAQPSPFPTSRPTLTPTNGPSVHPSQSPSRITASPTDSIKPSPSPSAAPITPTSSPSVKPSQSPSMIPSDNPSLFPSSLPSMVPSDSPSSLPSMIPSDSPSLFPSFLPSNTPSSLPTIIPSYEPSWLDDEQCKKKDPENDICAAIGGRCKLNCEDDNDFVCVPCLCSYNRNWDKPSKSTKMRELQEEDDEIVDIKISTDGNTERKLKAPKGPKSSCACRVPRKNG